MLLMPPAAILPARTHVALTSWRVSSFGNLGYIADATGSVMDLKLPSLLAWHTPPVWQA